MNLTVAIDWKVTVALGATAVAILLVRKLDATAAEKVSTCLADACKEFAGAQKSVQ